LPAALAQAAQRLALAPLLFLRQRIAHDVRALLALLDVLFDFLAEVDAVARVRQQPGGHRMVHAGSAAPEPQRCNTEALNRAAGLAPGARIRAAKKSVRTATPRASSKTSMPATSPAAKRGTPCQTFSMSFVAAEWARRS